MQLENACVQGNLKTHLGLTGAMHNHLRQTNQRISCLSEKALRNKAGIKRRKKNKKKKPLSFEWWGLVDNLAESKRYKLPKRPK